MHLAIILVKLSKLKLLISYEEENNYLWTNVSTKSDGLRRWEVLQGEIYQR